jgi:phosphate transport system substrate-binding protein
MKIRNLLIFIWIALFIITGCTSTGEMESIDTNAKQTITISGAWALYPMMVRWAEEFHADHPNVEFGIYPEEIEKGAFWISVTRDAVFLTVSKANPVLDDLHVQGISRETLVGIYITGEITTWGQVVERPEFQDPVHVYTRSDAAGAPATFAEYLGKKQEDLLGIGVYGDPGVLDAVIKDPLGIGYNNLNYAFDASSGEAVQGAFIVPLDVNADRAMEPEEWFETKEQAVRAVAEGFYPSPPARDLNLVTSGKPSGIVRDFIEWVLTNGQQYLDEVGYIGLSNEQLQNELSKME